MLSWRVTCLSAAVLAASLASSVHAGEGLPSQSMLSAMGLSGIEVMSDADALDVRGFGYDPWHGYGKKSVAIAYGHSYAKVSTYGAQASSEDGFYAKGRHKAAGAHGSYAGVKVDYGKKHKRGGGKAHHKRGGGKKSGHHRGGGKKGGHKGGKKGGGHKPKPKSKKVTAFAGGFSYASTH